MHSKGACCLQDRGDIIDAMMVHLGTTSIAETLVRLIGADEAPSGGAASSQQLLWLERTEIMPSLLSRLASPWLSCASCWVTCGLCKAGMGAEENHTVACNTQHMCAAHFGCVITYSLPGCPKCASDWLFWSLSKQEQTRRSQELPTSSGPTGGVSVDAGAVEQSAWVKTNQGTPVSVNLNAYICVESSARSSLAL